jgi:hypothetical protein
VKPAAEVFKVARESLCDDELVDALCEIEAAFPVLSCGCSRQLPTQSSSRLLFGGNSPALILSSALRMKGFDSIPMPGPECHGPVARSTVSSMIASARPLLDSTRPPTLPMSSAVPHKRHGPWAE